MFVPSQALQIAFRFSRGRKRKGMASLVSFISMLGIVIGVAVLIIGLSAMNGFERELNHRVLAVVPHGEIETTTQPFYYWQQAVNEANRSEHVQVAAPYINFTGLIDSGKKLNAVMIRGVDPIDEGRISALPQFVKNNAWHSFIGGKQQIILGAGVADKLGVVPGDWVTIMIPNNNEKAELLQPKKIRLQVSGIFQLNGQLDHGLALVPLVDAQRYLDMDNSITGIAIKFNDPFQASKYVMDVGRKVNQIAIDHQVEQTLLIQSWMSKYGFMYRDIQMIRTIMYLAMILVIGVACFNIVSTLIIAVKEKSSDIAILRTLGANDRLIRHIFIWYGLLAGMFGSVVGAIVGVILAWKLSDIIQLIEDIIGHRFLSGDIYFIDFLPSELHWFDVVCVLITAMILSLLASWYPAKRANQLNPARVLSGF